MTCNLRHPVGLCHPVVIALTLFPHTATHTAAHLHIYTYTHTTEIHLNPQETYIYTHRKATICSNFSRYQHKRDLQHKRDQCSCTQKRPIYIHTEKLPFAASSAATSTKKTYGMATISRLLHIIGPFCKRDLYIYTHRKVTICSNFSRCQHKRDLWGGYD